MNNTDDFLAVIDLHRPNTGSEVKGFCLPAFFTNLPSWQENYGAEWSDQYYADVAEFVGDEFDWQWFPTNFRFMGFKEYDDIYKS